LKFEETKHGSLHFHLLAVDVGCCSCRPDFYCSIVPAGQFQRTALGGPCWCLVCITIISSISLLTEFLGWNSLHSRRIWTMLQQPQPVFRIWKTWPEPGRLFVLEAQLSLSIGF
jgi:hypothetical protein